jgi:GNAT superfamily N-acetyltransferase
MTDAGAGRRRRRSLLGGTLVPGLDGHADGGSPSPPRALDAAAPSPRLEASRRTRAEPARPACQHRDMALVIRPARPGDEHGLAVVHVQAWQHAYRGIIADAFLDGLTLEARRTMWWEVLADPPAGTQVMVAEEDGTVVGFVGVGPADVAWANTDDVGRVVALRGTESAAPAPTGEVLVLNIRPDRWRRGVGGALLQRAEELLAGWGHNTCGWFGRTPGPAPSTSVTAGGRRRSSATPSWAVPTSSTCATGAPWGRRARAARRPSAASADRLSSQRGPVTPSTRPARRRGVQVGLPGGVRVSQRGRDDLTAVRPDRGRIGGAGMCERTGRPAVLDGRAERIMEAVGQVLVEWRVEGEWLDDGAPSGRREVGRRGGHSLGVEVDEQAAGATPVQSCRCTGGPRSTQHGV